MEKKNELVQNTAIRQDEKALFPTGIIFFPWLHMFGAINARCLVRFELSAVQKEASILQLHLNRRQQTTIQAMFHGSYAFVTNSLRTR